MKATRELFASPLKVINMGLSGFADVLAEQGVEVVSMDWRPPAGGKPAMLALLERLERLAKKGDPGEH